MSCLSSRETVSCALLTAAVLLLAAAVPDVTDAFVVPHPSLALVPRSRPLVVCHATNQPRGRPIRAKKKRRRRDGISEEDDAAFGAWLQEQSRKVSDPEFGKHHETDTGISPNEAHIHDPEDILTNDSPFPQIVKLTDSEHHEEQQHRQHRSSGVAKAKTTSSDEALLEDAIKMSASSFNFVEGSTQSLLQKSPVVALAIFVALGLIFAYMFGFFFLEGYISSPNPYENGAVPYFEDVPEEVLPLVDPVTGDLVDSITSDLNL